MLRGWVSGNIGRVAVANFMILSVVFILCFYVPRFDDSGFLSKADDWRRIDMKEDLILFQLLGCKSL